MKVLLDTNAYSQLMRGDPQVSMLVRRSEGVTMSMVVIGELLYGFRYGRRYAENRAQLEDFLAEPITYTLDVSLDTAERFGAIAGALRRKGRPIPTNDIWIAAHAVQAGAELLSYDAHFDAVDGLAWTHLAVAPPSESDTAG